MMSRLSAAAIAVLIALYPILIYFGLQKLSVNILSAALMIAFLVRLAFLLYRKKAPSTLPVYIAILGAALTISAYAFQSTLSLKLYPVAVNAACLIAFLFSLYRPPSAIELIARMADKNFPEEAVSYTRNVTIVWCIFFAVNGSVAVCTVLHGSMEAWTIYNGAISYCAIACLVAAEWVYRKLRIQRIRAS